MLLFKQELIKVKGMAAHLDSIAFYCGLSKFKPFQDRTFLEDAKENYDYVTMSFYMEGSSETI